MMMELQVSFSHIHLYVDHLEDLQTYKEFEAFLNDGSMVQPHEMHPCEASVPVDNNNNKCFRIHQVGCTKTNDNEFVSQNRDIIRQLLAGFGFRVTAFRSSNDTTSTSYSSCGTSANTKSFLVTSRDPEGVQLVVSALDSNSTSPTDVYHHFDAANIQRFFQSHEGRQGIAVLGFSIDNVDELFKRFQQRHPKLVLNRSEHRDDGCEISYKILEVYAYYQRDDDESDRVADVGTVLRFVEKTDISGSSSLLTNGLSTTCLPLPGLVSVFAKFEYNSQPAYCDHWVSNVHSRIGFLKTLEDVLGFTPKVDFNAGVVAAGEAQMLDLAYLDQLSDRCTGDTMRR